MNKALVEIPVDEETARVFNALPTEDRSRLQEVLSTLLREAAKTRRRTPVEVAREAGGIAQRNGLTTEILDELLRD